MAIFRYIFVVTERLGSEDLVLRLTQAIGEEGKEEMASVAEQLREEGERRGLVKGRVEGLAEGQRKVLLKLLRARFGELPEAAVTRVNAASVAQLDLWAECVLSAPTLADVLESP